MKNIATAILAIIIAYNFRIYSQNTQLNISGELYIKIQNYPGNFYINANVSLIGMGFSGYSGDQKVYSDVFTNESGTTQSITGDSYTIPYTNAQWAIEHIEDKGPQAGATWIGYGLYKITITDSRLQGGSFYFYIDYLDSQYPYGLNADIYVEYDYNRSISSPIHVSHGSPSYDVYPLSGQVVRVWADLFGQGSSPKGTDFYLHGNVPCDVSLAGDELFTKAIIDGDVTVNSGKTFSINRNQYPEYEVLQDLGLTFNSSTSLIVNGTISAQGTSASNITFDFISPNSSTQNGIIINSTGTASISYADISNAYNGVKITPSSSQSAIQNCNVHDCYDGISVQYGSKDADLTISGNTIQNNTHYGISIINSGYGMNVEPTISNNTITGCSSHSIYLYNISDLSAISGNNIDNNSNSAGIAMYYSSPHLTGNGVNSNYTGIGCASSSLPDIDNNDIEGNYRGVYSISSNPFLGQEIPSVDGGNNTITGNIFRDLQAESNSNIMAEHNWWGVNPPDANKIVALTGSSIDYNPWLPTPPGSRLAADNDLSGVKIKGTKFQLSVRDNSNTVNYFASGVNQSRDNFNPDWDLMSKLLYAKNLIKNKDITTAQNLLKDVINTNPDSSLSSYAINLLWNSYRNNDADQLKSFLASLSSKNQDKEAYGLAEIILAKYDKDNTPKSLDKIMTKYSSKNIKQMALFGKFLYYMNECSDKNLAGSVLAEIDNQYPGSYISEDAHIQLGDRAIPGNKFEAENKTGSALSEKSLNTNNLPVNYPNPFNPATTITYSLKERDHVTLKVYNVLGKEVAKLVDGIQTEGEHAVSFNGSSLPSGIYVYRLTGSNFNISKKMLLLK